MDKPATGMLEQACRPLWYIKQLTGGLQTLLRNTMKQSQTVVNIMSDAKLSEQNLYMLYIDFSSAFNTIDHDKLR